MYASIPILSKLLMSTESDTLLALQLRADDRASDRQREHVRETRRRTPPPPICEELHFLPNSGLKMGFYEGG